MISVIIPNYRRKELVLELLSNLYAQKNAKFEIIIVDDCSPDDSIETFKKNYPNTKILKTQKNSGPSVARNIGIQTATGEIIVGFDSDVSIEDTHLLNKIQTAFDNNPLTTGLAFKLTMPNPRRDDVERWWHPLPILEFSNKQFETDYFSGTAYAFRTKSILEAGCFPEYLYMHLEENVLSFRILDNNGIIKYDPTLEVIHHANAISRRSEVQTFYKPRNQVVLAIACMPLPKALTFAIPRIALSAIRSITRLSTPAFIRAMYSLVKNRKTFYAQRAPLKQSTWERIRKLKNQS